MTAARRCQSRRSRDDLWWRFSIVVLGPVVPVARTQAEWGCVCRQSRSPSGAFPSRSRRSQMLLLVYVCSCLREVRVQQDAKSMTATTRLALGATQNPPPPLSRRNSCREIGGEARDPPAARPSGRVGDLREEKAGRHLILYCVSSLRRPPVGTASTTLRCTASIHRHSPCCCSRCRCFWLAPARSLVSEACNSHPIRHPFCSE